MNQTTLIEKEQRLSQSQLWTGQRSFYDKKGIDAWANEVPFYITSNPFIANCYAELVIRFIQDWVKQHPRAATQPFYLLELGTGSGQFSYYTLKKITELQHQLGLSKIDIKYIMSDFTENNIKFWQSHKALSPFLEKKQLDFAIYDLENDKTIKLIKSGITLQPHSLSNPLIVIANYIFDSVKNDIFSVKKTKIKESLVSLRSKQKIDLENSNINWKKINIEFSEKPISDNYYSNKVIDAILNQYKNQLTDTQLLFPIGAINCIENLSQISNGKLLLISSDKGFGTLEEMEDLDYPELDFHGSFSLMVNYHAIGDYFNRNQGEAFIQTPRDGLVSTVCANGFRFDELPEMQRALNNRIEGFSPADYFTFYEHLSKTTEKATLETLLSFLCLSHWDSFIFSQIHSELIKKLRKADEQAIAYVTKKAPSIANNFYYVPGCDDVFFFLGLLHYEIDNYEKAIEYYLQSEKYFEPGFESTYNIGLCYYYAKQYKPAVTYFEKALKLNPRAKQVKDLLTKAKRKTKH